MENVQGGMPDTIRGSDFFCYYSYGGGTVRILTNITTHARCFADSWEGNQQTHAAASAEAEAPRGRLRRTPTKPPLALATGHRGPESCTQGKVATPRR